MTCVFCYDSSSRECILSIWLGSSISKTNVRIYAIVTKDPISARALHSLYNGTFSTACCAIRSTNVSFHAIPDPANLLSLCRGDDGRPVRYGGARECAGDDRWWRREHTQSASFLPKRRWRTPVSARWRPLVRRQTSRRHLYAQFARASMHWVMATPRGTAKRRLRPATRPLSSARDDRVDVVRWFLHRIQSSIYVGDFRRRISSAISVGHFRLRFIDFQFRRRFRSSISNTFVDLRHRSPNPSYPFCRPYSSSIYVVDFLPLFLSLISAYL